VNNGLMQLVDLRAQYLSIADDLQAAISRVVNSADFILGAEVAAFEQEFAAFCGVAHVVGCANGTDAIELVLRGIGVGPGDEVITVSHTFIGTTEGIGVVGATPVFVDVRDDTLLINPELVERAITWRTKAILAVHLYGQPAEMDVLADIARRHGVKLIEDAAQAHGSALNGRRAGSLADSATFSFYPGKNLGAFGDAGAIATNDADLARWIRKARNHGRASKYAHDFPGRNSRMDAIQGAVLRVKLRHLEDWNRRRRELAVIYEDGLDRSRFVPVGLRPECVTNYHLFVVRTADRDAVLLRLRQRGIVGGVHYPVPLHLQPAYSNMGYGRGSLAITEAAADSVLSLPLYAEMRTEDCLRVLEALSA
jgi:dTDP-4-amino-4,6-dideoxygalactose transaminase